MSNHPKQILYTAVYKWFQYSKSCDGMWDTKWITGGFPHCLGDFFIFHLDYMAECDALVTVVLLHDWGRFISVGAVQFVLPILDEKPLLYLSAPDSHRTWIRLLCLWQEGGGVLILTSVHYWLSILHILVEESDLIDRSCVQCKGDQGRTCFLSSSLEVRCLEIKWKASNQSRGHSRTKTALSVYSMNRLL